MTQQAAAVFLIGLATRRKAVAGGSLPSMLVAGTGAGEA